MKRDEKDIVDKCKDKPKQLYRFINGEIKQNITRLKENMRTQKKKIEALNMNFESESYFKSHKDKREIMNMRNQDK